jgi:hypothetical protein
MHQPREQIDTTDMGFEWVEDQKGPGSSDAIFHVKKLIRLGTHTCSERAANVYEHMNPCDGGSIKHSEVISFDEGVERLKETEGGVLLVPHLHPTQKELNKDPEVEELASHAFKLPNPRLTVATPTGAWNTTRQRLLFVLPALLPLVRETYGGRLPFKEIVPMPSTKAAAEYCVKIFGGGYCVVNEMQLAPWSLKPVRGRDLPHTPVTWRLYANI